MNLSRDFTQWIHFFLDECTPAVLRDQKWFMWPAFYLLFGDKAEIFFGFKDRAPTLTPAEFSEIYRQAAPVFMQRDTDLNQSSIQAIEQAILGETVLDIACGKGFLLDRLAPNYRVHGADIWIDDALHSRPYPCYRANLEHLPFPDQAFDTVICAHTLEHVQSPAPALQELRRVTARRLIVVLPRQRRYRYTFDLHLHFFPYRHCVLALFQNARTPGAESQCFRAGGDWVYLETRK